jgi:hypothetical protein
LSLPPSPLPLPGARDRIGLWTSSSTSASPVIHSSGVALPGNMPVRCKGPIPHCALPMRSANVTLRLDLLVSEVATLWAFRRRDPSLCFGKPNPAATDIHLAEKYFPTTLFSAGQRSQQRSVHRRGRDIANRQLPSSTRNHRTLADAATLLAANNQP